MEIAPGLYMEEPGACDQDPVKILRQVGTLTVMAVGFARGRGMSTIECTENSDAYELPCQELQKSGLTVESPLDAARRQIDEVIHPRAVGTLEILMLAQPDGSVCQDRYVAIARHVTLYQANSRAAKERLTASRSLTKFVSAASSALTPELPQPLTLALVKASKEVGAIPVREWLILGREAPSAAPVASALMPWLIGHKPETAYRLE